MILSEAFTNTESYESINSCHTLKIKY